MSAQQPPLNGDFYIDDLTTDLWLYYGNVWTKKGRLVTTITAGFYGEGPFLGGEQFASAPAETAVKYSQAYSGAHSLVTCGSPPVGTFDVVFTDDLARFMAYGERAICTAHFNRNNIATLTFIDAVVPRFQPTWFVLSGTADPSFAFLRALIGGEPA